MNKLTFERATELLSYNPVRGQLRWKVSTNRRIRIGQLAGSFYSNPVSKKCYWQIHVDGYVYRAHRVAWLLHTGQWPENDVDHEDGNGLNNKWTNLRDLDGHGNQQNRRTADKDSSTGMLGASVKGSRFVAQITVNNKRKYLGTYDTPEEAHQVYLAAKRELHPSCSI